MFVQMHLFNNAHHTNQFRFYIKQRHVKTEWGVDGGERKIDREKQIKQVRDGALERIRNRVG
jgi:hypothetical protein